LDYSVCDAETAKRRFEMKTHVFNAAAIRLRNSTHIPGDDHMAAADLEEKGIPASCALRFNGWEYLRTHPFDHHRALDHFFELGQWDVSEAERLCMFFLLYEGLFKLDLQNEHENGQHWQAFRSLFSQVARLQVPQEYEVRKYAEKWAQEYSPHLAEIAEHIRQIHDGCQDDDDGYSHVWF
jgi:hypothetical protein